MQTRSILAILALSLTLSWNVGAQVEDTKSPAAAAQDSGKKSKPERPAGPRFGVPTAPKKAEGTVRLAAYNLLNLFDHADDPALSGEWDDMKLAVTDDRAKGLADAIKRLDADILVLEEIESKEAVEWFRDTYLKGMGYDHVASLDAGYYRGVEQSVLSRFPLKDARVFLDPKLDHKPTEKAEGSQPTASAPHDPTKFQRSPLAVDVLLPGGYSLTLYAIHHKAGGKAFDDYRAAEAKKIIELATKDMKTAGRNVVLLGDFNATPNSDVRKLYQSAKFVNGYDYRNAEDIARQKQKLSAEDRDALNEKYTTHESERPIDYILMSPSFAAEAVPGSFFVLQTLYPGDAYDWKTDPHPAGYASDHRPIAIDFTPKDAGPTKKSEPVTKKEAASPQ